MNSLRKLFIILFLPLSCFSQVEFEKGYFVDRNNTRVDCLIEDRGWKNTPLEFRYKLDANGTVKRSTVSDVMEFGTESGRRYLAAEVNIDRTGDNLESLTLERNPVWQREQLFFEVLIQGKVSLLYYVDGNLQTFFYLANDTIRQLVHKKYTMQGGHIGVNDLFRQQLRGDVWCGDATNDELKRVDYTKKDLIIFFSNYNKCSGTTVVDYTQKDSTNRKSFLRLRITPGANVTTLIVDNTHTEVDFGTKVGFRMGLEFELVLPYNRNKWGIVAEPNFQSFKSNVSNTTYSEVALFEIPIGIRHYFFLAERSRLFIDGFVVIRMPGESQITAANVVCDVAGIPTVAVGAGYSFGRFSGEVRLYRNADILNDCLMYTARYNRVSFIFGYRFTRR